MPFPEFPSEDELAFPDALQPPSELLPEEDLPVSARARKQVVGTLEEPLEDNEVVFVDRLGPRILHTPSVNPPQPLDRETLRELSQGRLALNLLNGNQVSASRMKRNGFTVEANGAYSLVRPNATTNTASTPSITFQTINIWTGKPGTVTKRDTDDLIFYSLNIQELPSYYSWKGDGLSRRADYQGSEVQNTQDQLGALPSEQALVEQWAAELKSSREAAIFNDPESLLRHKPDIQRMDPAWQGVYAYFQWILDTERQRKGKPRVLKIIQEEFTESQKLLLIPAPDNSFRAKIQVANTQKYQRLITGSLGNLPDNLLTKFTMMCFGLPVAPLTLNNVHHAGGPEDVPAVDDDEDVEMEPTIQQIMWSEEPLKFLDKFNERSWGYPMMRSKFVNYLILWYVNGKQRRNQSRRITLLRRGRNCLKQQRKSEKRKEQQARRVGSSPGGRDAEFNLSCNRRVECIYVEVGAGLTALLGPHSQSFVRWEDSKLEGTGKICLPLRVVCSDWGLLVKDG